MKTQLIDLWHNRQIITICDNICLFSIYGIVFFLPISKAMIEGFSILAILSFLAKKSIDWKGIPKTPLNPGILFYLSISAFSIALSANPKISTRTFFAKTLEEFALFFVVAETLAEKKRIKNVLLVLFISSLLIGIDGIYQHFTSRDFIRHRPDLFDGLRLRVYASFHTPNAFGCYLTMIIPFLVSGIFYKKVLKFEKILYALLFILLISCLILTVSRGAWLAFLVSFLFMSMWIRLLWVFLLLIVIAVIILQPFCSQILKTRLVNFLNFFGEADTERKLIWQAAWRMFISKPWLGLGLGTFMFNFVNFTTKGYQGTASYAHNCYLQLAAEIGIVGLAAFILLLLLFFYWGVKKLNSAVERTFNWHVLLASLAAVAGYSTQMAVDTILYSLDLGMLFWLVLGIGVAALRNIESGTRVKK